MNVVIATDGSMDSAAAVAAVRPLAAEGTVTIMTVVEVPRRMLSELRGVYGERLGNVRTSDAEYVGIAPEKPVVGQDFPGDEAIIEQYLANQREVRTAPLAAAFADAGVEVGVDIVESDHAARSIVEYLKDHKADLVVMGAKGSSLFDSLLGSTSTKVARHAPCSVMLLR